MIVLRCLAASTLISAVVVHPRFSPAATTSTLATLAAPYPGAYAVTAPAVVGSSFASPALRDKSTTPSAPTVAASTGASASSGYLAVSFRALAAFPVPPPALSAPPTTATAVASSTSGSAASESGAGVIPRRIMALSGRRVSVAGYMIPVQLDAEGLVQDFLLVKDQSLCCFGVVPKANELIAVRMPPGRGAAFAKDIPLVVSGELEVAEVRQAGDLVGIYTMRGEAVRPAGQ